ncbi:MAG: hypothetical protein IKS51_04450 [Erysipelotrichaceae bacterium]|nr:hypothetical protein [Erysipelotrichaceae bacterium]
MKQKTYVYREVLYRRKVKFTGAYAGVLGLAAAGYFLFMGMNFLLIPVMVVCFYTYWETYVSLANPQEIVIDDRAITFRACGKEHTYLWKDIYNFRVKEFVTARKIFLRINKADMRRGRYWINCMYFNDTDELYMFLRDKEYEIHPDSMKAIARRTNEEEFKERQEKKAQKEAENEEKKNQEKNQEE